MVFNYSALMEVEKRMFRLGLTSKKDSEIRRNHLKKAIRKFENSLNISDLFLWIPNGAKLPFVVDNYIQLLKTDIFEEFLFDAYISASVNNSNVQADVISFLLNRADRGKLFAQGDQLPYDNAVYTLYRGISGKGRARRKYGHSWTGLLEKAIWFSERMEFEKPMVYQADVPKENIYFYTNGRGEDEYVCYIPQNLKLKEVWKKS